MHSMYAIVDAGSGPELIKLYVEEMNNPASVETSKRAYTLVNIEKAPNAGGRVQANSPSSGTNTLNAVKNVADLFAKVKALDANFSPNPVNKDLLDSDGTMMEVLYQSVKDSTVLMKIYLYNITEIKKTPLPRLDFRPELGDWLLPPAAVLLRIKSHRQITVSRRSFSTQLNPNFVGNMFLYLKKRNILL